MIRKRVFIVIVLIVIFGFTALCFIKILNKKENEIIKKANNNENKKVSVWAVYWDLDRVPKEVSELEKHIDNFCYFAAYYDNKNQLILPESTVKIFQYIEKKYDDKKWKNYLTVVNDKMIKDGVFSHKDTSLLYELFKSDESIKKNTNQIISLALLGGYDGIEIDYEAIKKDMQLWRLYEKFCSYLYKKSSEAGLQLRVLLEPSAPIEKLMLPEGPDYVIMCYNLHGPNTKPGPKADKEFIRKLVEKMSVIPGKKEFALATGGFDWDENGEVKAVTQLQAKEIIKEYNAETMRDDESCAIKFSYEDEKGKKHEVWYADMVTINCWIDIIEEYGSYGISIWRLGGNYYEEF
ncbi:glycosyl hydrolase [Caloramator sp. E03]|uniref:glycosyl hydrolase family 18 protein n=1 Tax=Caloramator sp. E03 TaxID=2576307 RepID=UPI001110BBAC|nr:glycosyl hydrolase family 18 protein [Caloramator sp. E03]QCX34692.1 glycosyl hydrolase [Caloramator sp. E03]